MHLKDYRNDLLKRLKDPEYSAAYLAQVLGDGDNSAFLLALKDVVEASGGVGSLADHVDVQRPSLYRILSKKGNPRLNTLKDILKPLGLQVSVTVTRIPAISGTHHAVGRARILHSEPSRRGGAQGGKQTVRP